MANKASIQDEYLKKMIAGKTPVRVLLVSGKDLHGIIKSCDAFTLILELMGQGNRPGGIELLIYKSAIAVVGPQSRGND